MFGKVNLLLLVGIVFCLGLIYFVQRDPSEPNYELIPERQMALSPAFGTYAPNPNFPDGITFRQPAPGTISRGSQPFPYGPAPTEMVRAGKELSNPLSFGHPEAKQAGRLPLCHLLPVLPRTNRQWGRASFRARFSGAVVVSQAAGPGHERW